MKDMEAHSEKLRRDAAECAIIRDLATDPKKRELFTKLAKHMSVLASDVERAQRRPVQALTVGGLTCSAIRLKSGQELDA